MGIPTYDLYKIGSRLGVILFTASLSDSMGLVSRHFNNLSRIDTTIIINVSFQRASSTICF